MFSQQMRKLLWVPTVQFLDHFYLSESPIITPQTQKKKERSNSNSLQKVQSLFIFQQRTLWVRVILGGPWIVIQPIREELQSVESKDCCLSLSCGKISGSGVLLLPLIGCMTLGKSVACPLASVSPPLEEDHSAPHLRMSLLLSTHLLLYGIKPATQLLSWHTIRATIY